MKYYVEIYNERGRRVTKSVHEAKSYRDAIHATEIFGWGGHALVVNEKLTARRYAIHPKTLKISALKGDIGYFDTWFLDKPSVLVLIGTTPEFHQFENEGERDEAFACMTFDPAGSVEQDKGPKDITVLSEETSGSRSGSTSQKTSNGSATSVTWMAKRIQWSTAKSSGKGKSENTEKNTWSTGSKASHSKQKSTSGIEDLSFKAKVKNLSLESPWDYIVASDNGHQDSYNTLMKDLAGGIYEFTPAEWDNWYTAEGYNWHISWIRPIEDGPSLKEFEEFIKKEELSKLKAWHKYAALPMSSKSTYFSDVSS